MKLKYVLLSLLLVSFPQAGRAADGAAPPANSPRAQEALARLESMDPVAVAAAVDDMALTWPDTYDAAPCRGLLNGLAEREALLAALRDGQADAVERAEALAGAARAALLELPLLRGKPILFVVRPQFANEHGPDETMFQSNEHNARFFAGGGALKRLDIPTGRVTTLLDAPNGIIRDPAVHFDGRRILFSMRRDRADDYHLYEIGADGSGLRQLTIAPRVSDIQPVWLPDGRVLFSSTREPKYIQCQRHLMASLFLMEADGANIRQIGFNTLFEGRSSLMPDGRVLYSRWEYVDKHFSSAYGLWTTNPDGTAQQLHYGGLAWQPGAILDGRAVPGGSRLICVFGSVHDHENGALVLADPARGGDGPETILRSWPADLVPMLQQWNLPGRAADYDSFRRVAVRYQNPYPLSDKYFLCSRSISAQARQEMGIFLVDVFGNETLLHHEAPGCFQPMPLVALPPPPALPPRAAAAAGDEGVFFVADVYRGYGMEAVPRGSVKWLRVVEAPAKLTYPPAGHGDWSAPGDGESHHPTAVNWNHYNPKRVLGTAPVAPDGSAHFRAPARRFVYFQLLDADGLMVHSMRSGTALQPGEFQACAGCHDYRSGPPVGPSPSALREPPSDLLPWYGPPRPFSYAGEVQPVLDRQCVRCHDYGKEDPTLILTGDLGPTFNASYVAMMARSPSLWTPPVPGEKKPLVSTIGSGPVPVVPPYSWGSHRSRLVDLLRAGHKDVKLTPEEFDRIITWVDLNAPYYPFEEDYYTANTYGRSPLDHAQLLNLGRIASGGPRGAEWGWSKVDDYTGGKLNSLLGRGELPVNFTRPELSTCLRAFDGPGSEGYAAALALIRAGQEQLARYPRADMPGFQPCEADRQRLEFHAGRRRIDEENRRAAAAGMRIYDAGP